MQFRTDDAIPELRAITANGAAFKELGLNGSQLVFNTSSTERMRIDSSGNVNINTTTGNGSLNVKAPTGNGLISIITGTTTSDSIRINSGGSTTNWLEYRGYLGHAWFTDAGLGDTERMRIDSSGNIGIGTTSPTYPLTINTGAGTFSVRAKGGSSVSIASSASLTYFGDTHEFSNSAGTSEAMRIDSAGNVGIGTSSPSALLEIQTAGTTGNQDFQIFSRGVSPNYEVFKISRSAGSTELLANQNLTLSADYDNNHTGVDSSIIFKTDATERMRITSGGFLKASNTGSYNNASGTYHEQVSNISSSIVTNFQNTSSVSPYGIDIDFSNLSPNNSTNYFIYALDSTAVKFIVYSNGNVVNTNNSYGAISDIKLKENIEDASPKLDDLMQVKVRNYNLIGEETKQLGVVAQELEEVFPSMVSESPDTEQQQVPQLDDNGQEVLDENGDVVMTTEKIDLGTTTKSVKYSVFVPMLIKAMQEQQEIINDLKSRIETLENN